MEKTKKQTEELEVHTILLNAVKVSLNERIAKYGEEDEKQSSSENTTFGLQESIDFGKNLEGNSRKFRYCSDQLDSDSFSSCSTSTFEREETKSYTEDSFQHY